MLWNACLAPYFRLLRQGARSAHVLQVLQAPEALLQASRAHQAASLMLLERPRAHGVGLESRVELKILVAPVACLAHTAIRL